MAALPTVGGDAGAWGTELNSYLLVGHDASGRHTQWFNVKDYGAKGDGSTDDTAAIQAALDAANTAGGGTVFFPRGTFISQALALYSYVHLRGAGVGATVLQLKSGTNADLINGGATNLSYISLSASFQSGNNGGLVNWGLYDLTLDGNKARQSGGTSYPLRVYGYGYVLQNVRVRNGYSGGVLADWNGASYTDDAMEAQWSNVKVHDNSGIGVQLGGPHDTQWSNVIVYHSGSHDIHLAPNCVGLQAVNCHAWGDQTGVAWLIEAPDCLFSNCEAEGSSTMNVALLANQCAWIGGRIFESNAAAYSTANGVQLGQQAGQTPYSGQIQQSGGLTTAVAVGGCRIDTIFTHCEGPSGCVWHANDGGNNLVKAVVFGGGGNVYTGTPHLNTHMEWTMNGLTGNTNQSQVRLAGSLALRSDGPASLNNNNTINTAARGQLRITTTAAVTGIIMQAGQWRGQVFVVVNESANTITFAASSSNVADGSGDVIAAKTARMFVWDDGTSLWYRLA